MKKLLLIIIIATATLPVMAQSALNIEGIFSRYGKEKGCKMVEMHGCTIKGYHLAEYKSLEFTTHRTEIEQLLNKDRENAKTIQEVIDNGVLLGGYYIMPQAKKSLNRYILYRRGSGKTPSVIVYMVGNIRKEELMKITKK